MELYTMSIKGYNDFPKSHNMLRYNNSSGGLLQIRLPALKYYFSKRPGIDDAVAVRDKLTSRKNLLGGKLASIRETLPGDLKDHKKAIKKQAHHKTTDGENQFALKRNLSYVNKGWETQFLSNFKREALETLNDNIESEIAEDFSKKFGKNLDRKTQAVVPGSLSKTVTLNNLLGCLNTDKKLTNNRSQFRVR